MTDRIHFSTRSNRTAEHADEDADEDDIDELREAIDALKTEIAEVAEGIDDEIEVDGNRQNRRPRGGRRLADDDLEGYVAHAGALQRIDEKRATEQGSTKQSDESTDDEGGVIDYVSNVGVFDE